jgi:hypothetical protein
MNKLARVLAVCALLVPALSYAEPTDAPPRDAEIIKTARADRSVPAVILFYLPNRFFDVLDILRVRVRVGPGIAVRARATEGIDVGIGSYSALFVGLPGPRQRVKLPLPLGFESYTGIELGPGDAQLDSGASPAYASTEIGVSLHAAVAGFDLGIDPFEIVDWLAGLVLIDFRADDY